MRDSQYRPLRRFPKPNKLAHAVQLFRMSAVQINIQIGRSLMFGNRSAVTMLAFAIIAAVKEPTGKLIITGPASMGTVEITDSSTLALANLYSGNFLDTTRGFAVVLDDAPRYEVTFWLPVHHSNVIAALFDRSRWHKAYVVYFSPDPSGFANYVYLPGPGDAPTGSNHGTIVRAEREGHWSYASPAWGERIAQSIARARRTPPT
jgi:hypothetical protein